MAFKENLLKKMELDKMRKRVLSTLGPSGGGSKIDRKAMKDLLKAAEFRYMNLRGLDLYTPDERETDGKQVILVLDNELPVYHSTLNDVLLRKEPTLKEMISIRNAMKILNDKDVVVSRKERSVETVYKECIARLNLSYTDEDIKKLEYDGRSAVEWNDTDMVIQSIDLFSELLGYVPEPKAMRIENHYTRGAMTSSASGSDAFGPSVVFNSGDGTIRLIRDSIALSDNDGIQMFMDKVSGRKDADLFGPKVIEFLSAEVIRMKPLVKVSG
jgi:hypothetical protein